MRIQRQRSKFFAHLTLFVGALITGAGIALALIAWHYQTRPESIPFDELLYAGKVMVGVGTVMHVLSFFIHVLD